MKKDAVQLLQTADLQAISTRIDSARVNVKNLVETASLVIPLREPTEVTSRLAQRLEEIALLSKARDNVQEI